MSAKFDDRDTQAPYRSAAPVPPIAGLSNAAAPRPLSRAEQYLVARDIIRKQRVRMAMLGMAMGVGLFAVGVGITWMSKGHLFAYGALFTGGMTFITSVMAAARAMMD